MLRNTPIGLRLYLILVVMLAAVVVIAIGGVQAVHQRIQTERQSQARILVEAALGHLHYLDDQARVGAISHAEARTRGVEAIASMSWRKNDYLWINDLNPVIVWHPLGEWIGRDVSQTRDPSGRLLFQEFVERTAAGEGAFVSYLWPRPGSAEPRPKLSYVQRFEPWGWIIGSGIYVDDLDQVWRDTILQWGSHTGLIGLIGVLLAWWIGKSVTRPLAQVTRTMRRLAQGLDVPEQETDREDEIGDLIRATQVFRASIEQREAARRDHDRVLRQAKTVFDHISEGVMVSDDHNRIIAVNPSFTRITGFEAADVIGKNPSLLSSGRHDEAFYRALWAELLQAGEWHGEVWNKTKAGEVFPESLSISVLKTPDGRVEGYVATFLDITDRKRREATVRWRAEHDALTNLLNRAQFEARLANQVRLAKEDGCSFALLYLDLDGFKQVNDTLGHAAGDKVLKRAAARIEGAVRTSDLVARLGGDEFAIIVPGVQGPDDAGRIATKLVASLAEPFEIDGVRVQVGASVGIALYPQDGIAPDTLVAAADEAMYRAKRAGRGSWQFHAPGLVTG
ncbi:PAS:GGDEF [Magnetospirillum sp. LM-5]|uniref:diguanylate cyclase domain-containing protein n=1 Tax=Magnetospirillum sp. LM-5 TaxID=2681466 RepID=UPI0013853236|nr:diguanylate cyclase [Magnetospirillum sp. LM-5]CAA7625277.1 PAS:GGDEF [Magnetospirillum sp. LM-5]